MLGFLNKLIKTQSSYTPEAMKEAVEAVIAPLVTPTPVHSLVQVSTDLDAYIALEVPSADPAYESLRRDVESAAGQVDGAGKVHVVLTAKAEDKADLAKPAVKGRPAPPRPRALPHVKRVIMVASGKGGVGKSTVCANLAVAMAAQGLKVGLMDADIYGPSQPIMMGISGLKPEGVQGRIEPIVADSGVKVASIGLMVDADKALIWRGPIVQKALLQLTFDVNWGSADAPLDIVLIDMPPGTGDVPLSLAQKVCIDGAVIVSTPQDIALADVRRGIAMFEKTEIPVLGVVENMSTHICSECGHEEPIFGYGGVKLESEKRNVPYLGSVPLSASICYGADHGNIKPSESFLKIAEALV